MKKEKYPSAESYLKVISEEYSLERGRANDLDNKAGFFITLSVAISTIFIPIIPFDRFRIIFSDGDCSKKCMGLLFVILLAIAFILLIISLLLLYNAIKIRKYNSVNTAMVIEQNNFEIARDLTDKGLCKHYQEIIDFNVQVNEEKASYIEKAMRFGGIGFIFMVISTIGLLVLLT